MTSRTQTYPAHTRVIITMTLAMIILLLSGLLSPSVSASINAPAAAQPISLPTE